MPAAALGFTGMASLLMYALLLVMPQRGVGTLAGRIVSVDGTPVAGVRVAAVDASDTTTMASLAQTGSDGRYLLENVLAGRYYILGTQDDRPSYYSGAAILSEAKIVSVTGGAAISALDFKFVASSGILRLVRTPSPASGRFFGTVSDTQGKPLQNVAVILSDSQTNARFMTGTNAAGAFEFSDLPVQQLSMEILSPVQTGYKGGGYEQLQASITLRPRETLQEDIRLRLVLADVAQQRPDLYARPVKQTRGPGVIGRVGSGTGPLRTISAQAGPLHYPSGVIPQVDDAIVLQAVIGADGSVLSLRALSPSVNPELVRAAIEAVSRWIFTPMDTSLGVLEQFGTITVDFARNN